jgi:hypothetical protein
MLVKREAEVLAAIASRPLAGRSVPRVIHAGPCDAGFLLIQSTLPGTPVSGRLTTAHLRFLESLESAELKPLAGIGQVQSLIDRLNALSGVQDLLAAMKQCLAVMGATPIPSTIIHGDFAPWNLRRHHDDITAFDWEYGLVDGLPLLDEIHHVVQVGYLLKKWSVARAEEELLRHAHGHRRYAPKHARSLQIIYLIDILARLLEEQYSEQDPMVEWQRLLLGRLATVNAKAGFQ